MSTRFYFPIVGPPDIPTNWQGTWDATYTSSSKDRLIDPVKDGPYYAVVLQFNETTATSPWTLGLGRCVSRRLAAQTISGTLGACLRVYESNADAEFYDIKIYAYVTQGDDLDSVRGVLLDYTPPSGTTEWPAGSPGAGLTLAGQTLSSVEVTEGDHLVVEIGTVSRNTHTTSRYAYIPMGCMSGGYDTVASDITDGATSGASWIEFSGTVSLKAAPSNDDYANAIAIQSLPYSHSCDQSMANRTFGSDPVGSCNGSRSYHPVYYTWTAPSSGDYVATATFSGPGVAYSYNWCLSIWTGSPGSFSQFGCRAYNNPDYETITFTAVQGTTYTFLCSSCGYGLGGDLTFTLESDAPANPPANDHCADATAISTLPYSDTVDTTDADNDGGAGLSNTVWYTYTGTGEYISVAAQGEGFVYYTVVAYTGSCGSLTEVKRKAGTLRFRAENGIVYHFLIGVTANDGIGSSLTVTVTEIVEQPIVDGFEYACGYQMRMSPYAGIAINHFSYSLQVAFASLGDILAPVIAALDFEIQSVSNNEQGELVTCEWDLELHYYANGSQSNVEVVNTPFPDPLLNHLISYERVNWQWHTYELRGQASTYNPNTFEWTDDGWIQVRLDGQLVFDLTNLAVHLSTTESNPDGSLSFGFGCNGDVDNCWAMNGTAEWPSYIGTQYVPTHADLVTLQTFNAGSIAPPWQLWIKEGSIPPFIGTICGRDGSGGMSLYNSDPALYGGEDDPNGPNTGWYNGVYIAPYLLESQYDCPTASPGPTICGVDEVLTWIEQSRRITSGETMSRVVSDAPLNDPDTYYLGKKEPRVLEFGTITRELSDSSGQWRASSMTWREAEVDRAVRAKFASATEYPVVNAVDVCRMIRVSEWRDKQPARLMFIGHRISSTPAEDMSIEHESGDHLARDLEVAGAEIECPRRLFSKTYTPEIPKELVDVPEPIIYGAVSDELSLATPPNMDSTAPWGGFWVETIYPTHGWAPMPSACDPPTEITITQEDNVNGHLNASDYPGNKLYVIMTSVDAQGRESDPSTYAASTASDVDNIELSGTNKRINIQWTEPVTGDPPSKYRCYLGLNYYGVRYFQYIEVDDIATLITCDDAPSYEEWTLANYNRVDPGWTRADGRFGYYRAAALVNGQWTAFSPIAGYAHSGPYQRTNRIEFKDVPEGATEVGVWKFGPGDPNPTVNPPYLWTSVPYTGSPLPTYVDDDWLSTGWSTVETYPHEVGAIDLAPYYGGKELVPYDGEYWHRWFVSSHANFSVQPFINGAKAYTEAGVDWLWPGSAGYAERFGNSYYRDFNGRRYSVVYGRGATADAIATGESVGSPSTTGTLRVNVHGIEEMGDGSGPLITNIFEQEIHWWANFGPLGNWQTGAWLELPTWDPIASHCKFSTESWRTASSQAETAFGSELVGAVFMKDRNTMRDWIAKWRLSTDTRIGQNAAGQWMISWEDPDASISRTFTEVFHIQADSVEFSPMEDEHWTKIPFTFGENYVDGSWQEGFVSDETETLAYGEERVGPSIEMSFVRSQAQALFLAMRVLVRHARLPWRVSFETINLCGTNADLGDVIGCTGSWGLGLDGWSAFPLYIIGIEVMPSDQRCRLSGTTLIAPHLITSP